MVNKDQGPMSFRQQMVGFPYFQVIIISLIRFTEPIAFTSFFPYVYFMLIGFGIKESDTWRLSAYLAATFAFFQFVFSISWCTAADKYGRKPTLLVSLMGTAIAMIIFGFAKSFWVCFAARSLMGGFTVIPVIRTIVGEITTKRRHQPIAFSTIPLFWNLGSVVGPAIGGSKLLTRVPQNIGNPEHILLKRVTLNATQAVLNSDSHSLYNEFMDKYPYALSNIVVALYIVLSIVLGFLFLDETHPTFWNKKDYGIEIGDKIRSWLGFKVPARPWHDKVFIPPSAISSPSVYSSDANLSTSDIESMDESTPLRQNLTSPRVFYNDDTLIHSDIEDDAVESNSILSKRTSNAIIRRYSEVPQLHLTRTNTINEADDASIFTFQEGVEVGAFTKPVIQTITANFIIAFHNIIYWEFIPVFLAGEFVPENLKFPFTIKGGFGFNSNSIGHLLSYTGLIGVLGVMILFPLLDRHMRAVVSYRLASSVFPILYVALPFLIFTLPGYNPKFAPWVAPVLLYTLSALSTVCSSICFPQIFILIHRASPPKHRSYINGASLSLTSLARCLAPLVWGSVMTITEKYAISEVAWFLLAALALVGFVQAFFLEDYDEDLKGELEDE